MTVPRRVSSFPALEAWCSHYQIHGTLPLPRYRRFSIGIYQFSQALQWPKQSPAAHQSYCSAAMHFIMCASAYGLPLEQNFPLELSDVSFAFKGWEHMMLLVGKAQQQVVYSEHEHATSSRASRFSPSELSMRLSQLVEQCFALVPPDYRCQGCEDEMLILCRDLPKRKEDRHA